MQDYGEKQLEAETQICNAAISNKSENYASMFPQIDKRKVKKPSMNISFILRFVANT